MVENDMVSGTTHGADKFQGSKRIKLSFIIFPEPVELNLIVKTCPTLTSIEILNKTKISQFKWIWKTFEYKPLAKAVN